VMRMFWCLAACGAFVAWLSAVGAASAQTAPNPAELVYTPIAGCRAFDTRATAAIGSNQVRSFHVSGSSNFPGQGGPAHGCGVPGSAKAVSLSRISLSQAAAGYLTAFAYNAARPASVSLYYQRNLTIANAVIAPINQGNVSIFSSQQSHVAGDVTGYYAPPIGAIVFADGTLGSGAARITQVQHGGTGSYTLYPDVDVGSCTVTATVDQESYGTLIWARTSPALSAPLGGTFPSALSFTLARPTLSGSQVVMTPTDARFSFAVRC
ncbi:MAG: hypothetical protein ABW275_01570, partial [Hansschlegelia sp.]